MDMFMDKLAQKLTAQEIIKANTAADVEELNKLKNQIAEYNECLVKLQKLIDDGAARFPGIRTGEEETARALEEGNGRTEALRKDVESLQKLLEQQQERLDGIDRSAAGQMESLGGQVKSLSAGLGARMEALAGQTEGLSASVGEKIDQLCGQLEAQASGGLSERLDLMEENVHKECVKVYRNVQAVIAEESGRQSEALSGTKADLTAVRGKLGAVLGISLAAMILSLAGVAIQVLSGLHLLPF